MLRSGIQFSRTLYPVASEFLKGITRLERRLCLGVLRDDLVVGVVVELQSEAPALERWLNDSSVSRPIT